MESLNPDSWGFFKKLLKALMIIIDIVLWFVLFYLGMLITTAAIATALYLPGIVDINPSLTLEKVDNSLLVISAVLSIGGVLTKRLPGSKKKHHPPDVSPFLCTLEVQPSQKNSHFVNQTNKTLSVYTDYLTLSGKEPIKIYMHEIQSVSFFTGELVIKYRNETLSFIFPAFIPNVSETAMTKLFLTLINGLKRKEDVTETIKLIYETQGALEHKTNIIIWLIKIACFSMLISFFILVLSNETVGFILLFFAFACMIALFPVSLAFSNSDFAFRNKNQKM